MNDSIRKVEIKHGTSGLLQILFTAFLLAASLFSNGQPTRDFAAELEAQRPKDIPMALFLQSRYIEDLLCVNETPNRTFVADTPEAQRLIALLHAESIAIRSFAFYRLNSRYDARPSLKQYFMIRAALLEDAADAAVLFSRPRRIATGAGTHTILLLDKQLYTITFFDKRFRRKFLNRLLPQIFSSEQLRAMKKTVVTAR